MAYLGAANTFLGKNADAVTQYEKALAFATQNGNSVLALRILTVKSQAFERKKDIIGAIRALDDGIQMVPEGQDKLLSFDSEINLAQLYSRMGNRYRSVEIYKKLLKIAPTFPERIGLMAPMYKRAGDELRMLGKTKQSINMFKKAFLLHKSQEDYLGQAHSLNGIAKAHLLRGEYEKMADLCRKCLPITQHVGDKVLEADLVNMLGTYYMELGQITKATEHFEVALDLSRTGKNHDAEARNMKSLGELNHSQGAYHYALDLFNKALALVKTTGNSSLQGWVHHCIAKTADVIDEQKMSLENFEKAIQIARQMSDKYAEAKLAYDMGLAFSKKTKYYKAIENFKNCLLTLATTDNRALEIIAAKELGIAYRGVGDTNHSLEAFQKGLQKVQQVEDTEQEAEVLRQLGITYSSAGERLHAIDIYMKSLRITREIGDRILEAGILGSLADEYMAIAECTKALECFEGALAIFDTQSHDRQGRANAMLNLAEACLAVANIKRALELSETSLPLAVSSGDRKLEARAIMVMGRIFQVTAPARALRHFEQSISISREMKDRVAEAWCLMYLGNTYNNLRDAKAGYMIESALTVGVDLNLVFLRCKSLMSLGITHADSGEYITAIEKLAEGMKLARSANIKSTEAEILYHLGQCYESALNLQLAFKYFSRANGILDKADDFFLHAKVLAALGLVCLKLEKVKDGHQHLLRSMPLLDKLGDKLIQIEALEGLGSSYSQLGKRQEAISAFQRAFTLIPGLGEEESIINLHIGNLNRLLSWENLLLGKTKFAGELAEKAISYSQDSSAKCKALMYLAEVHLVLGPVKLMDFVSQAASLAKLAQDSILIIKSNLLLARAHLLMGKPADAVKVLEICLSSARSNSLMYLEATSLCYMGEACCMLANYTQGVDSLEAALAISKRNEYHLLQIHILVRLGKIYRELRVYTLSMEYLEQSQTALVHYPDRNTEAQAYIFMSETCSSQSEHTKAYELLRGAQGIAQETMNSVHLNLCKERIPKEFKKKEKKKKKQMNESFRFEREKEKARERALGGPQARGSFVLKKRNRIASSNALTNNDPLPNLDVMDRVSSFHTVNSDSSASTDSDPLSSHNSPSSSLSPSVIDSGTDSDSKHHSTASSKVKAKLKSLITSSPSTPTQSAPSTPTLTPTLPPKTPTLSKSLQAPASPLPNHISYRLVNTNSVHATIVSTDSSKSQQEFEEPRQMKDSWMKDSKDNPLAISRGKDK
eukprot:Phypoly_transcript_00738.p1 GENE.Phypoly_transcript_00738~~Phypoly_transcript_00738.p1  ORF type:complete len:1375 (-),score=209.00 Phypoly_transcript_00738:22-3720(-)